jgi:hypothetical protein
LSAHFVFCSVIKSRDLCQRFKVYEVYVKLILGKLSTRYYENLFLLVLLYNLFVVLKY